MSGHVVCGPSCRQFSSLRLAVSRRLGVLSCIGLPHMSDGEHDQDILSRYLARPAVTC